MSEIKTYQPREERWNIYTHAFGVILMPVCFGVLLYYAHGGKQIFACALYIVSLTAMYLGSSLYHAAKEPCRRLMLRRVDHAMIYFLISGTYTPLMLLAVGGKAGMTVLSVSWAIALTGMTLELAAIKPFKGFSLMMYLISGWLCVSVFGRLMEAMPRAGMIFLFAGGVVYTAGVIFYVSRRFGAHALWHIFVLVGALLHYCAVLTLLIP